MWFKNLVHIKIPISFSSKNIPVCETRVMRRTLMPWSDRIAIHPLENGNVEITEVIPRKVPKGTQLN